jgi:hypothetical protein
MRRLILALPLLALAACHAKVDLSDQDGNAADGNVHMAVAEKADGKNQVSLSVPGFSANVSLPNLDLGSHTDLDGMKLAPGTSVKTFDVNGRDDAKNGDDHGTVRLSFANPDAPAKLIDYYRSAAAGAGYRDIQGGGDRLAARKGDKQFALMVSPQGAGSQGTITLTDQP